MDMPKGYERSEVQGFLSGEATQFLKESCANCGSYSNCPTNNNLCLTMEEGSPSWDRTYFVAIESSIRRKIICNGFKKTNLEDV